MLHSGKYQDNPVIQKRMDVLKLPRLHLDQGRAALLSGSGKELNPYIGLYLQREPGSGWMLAMLQHQGA